MAVNSGTEEEWKKTWNVIDNPMHVKVRGGKRRALSLRMQRTPIKDFINFKLMTSNEILLNLENHKNFESSELVGGLVELSRRD